MCTAGSSAMVKRGKGDSMVEQWRAFLYYPLGILPSVFFISRLIIQWWQSEKYQKSYVGPIFWRLSAIGNILLLCHYFVQVQYPFALLQTANAVISWRNLHLMFRKPPYSTAAVIGILFFWVGLVSVCFLAQSYWVIGECDWIRSPTKFLQHSRQHHAFSWHLVGTFGGVLFSSRFWVQWWQVERNKKSELDTTFWWLSILGAGVSIVYFSRIQDTVSALRYSVGIIPYFRNLLLIRRSKLST
ncbi:MAG: lipid-A-disaccharide synthase N-terminal domain-containing protein [Waddliaceae bacterium]